MHSWPFPSLMFFVQCLDYSVYRLVVLCVFVEKDEQNFKIEFQQRTVNTLCVFAMDFFCFIHFFFLSSFCSGKHICSTVVAQWMTYSDKPNENTQKKNRLRSSFFLDIHANEWDDEKLPRSLFAIRSCRRFSRNQVRSVQWRTMLYWPKPMANDTVKIFGGSVKNFNLRGSFEFKSLWLTQIFAARGYALYVCQTWLWLWDSSGVCI